MTDEISITTSLAITYASFTLNRAKAVWNHAQEKQVSERMKQLERMQRLMESFGYRFQLPSKDVVREQIFKEEETAGTFEEIKIVMRKINKAYLRNTDSVKLTRDELLLITAHKED